MKLRRLSRAVSRWYDDDVRSLGLKGSQYALLSHVVKLAPIQPGALARAMGLEASTLTRNLRPLLDAGWVALQPGPDARSRLVVDRRSGAGGHRRSASSSRWGRRAWSRCMRCWTNARPCCWPATTPKPGPPVKAEPRWQPGLALVLFLLAP